MFDDPARDAWQKPHEVIQALKLAPDAVVADIGAGTGYFSLHMHMAGIVGQATCTDISPGMIEVLEANASMLDESTAVVEAMMVAKRSSKSEANVFYAHHDLFPQTKQLLEHRSKPLNIDIRYFSAPSEMTEQSFGMVIQYITDTTIANDTT